MKLNRNRWQALVALLLTYFVSAAPGHAATATKKAPAKKSSTAAKASTKKPASTSSAKRSSSKSGKSGSTTARRRTPAPPPRQNSPSPDRYREIQQALIDKGYSASSADGTWGPGWVDSLRRFQADQNLEADGKLGALSLIALGLGPKRQALQLPPPPPGAAQQQVPSQQLLSKPEGASVR